MTQAEATSYAVGVRDVAALARHAADRLETSTRRPLAVGFAVEALRALAEAADEMLAEKIAEAGPNL